MRVLFEDILLKPLISLSQSHWLPIDVDFLFWQGNGPLSFFGKLSTMLLTILRQGKTEPKTDDNTLNKITLLFLCIPVSPGRSRVIWSFPRNFATSLAAVIPKWYQHITNNLVLDSDLYLLHLLVILVRPYYMFTISCNFERKRVHAWSEVQNVPSSPSCWCGLVYICWPFVSGVTQSM